MRRAFVALSSSALLFAVGCSHTVMIDSDPTGAEIKVNGEKVGTAPITYSEQTGWEKVYDIEASKAGFKTTRKQIKQTEWNIPISVASGGCSLLLGTPLTVIGAVPLVGLFWARQLPDRVVVSMDRAGGGAPDGTTPPSSYGY